MALSTSIIPAFTPVKWGILSAGKISEDFIKAMSITEGAGTFYESIQSDTSNAHTFQY